MFSVTPKTVPMEMTPEYVFVFLSMHPSIYSHELSPCPSSTCLSPISLSSTYLSPMCSYLSIHPSINYQYMCMLQIHFLHKNVPVKMYLGPSSPRLPIHTVFTWLPMATFNSLLFIFRIPSSVILLLYPKRGAGNCQLTASFEKNCKLWPLFPLPI